LQILDLSPMKDIRVDPIRRTAQAQPGLRLGEWRTARSPPALLRLAPASRSIDCSLSA